MDSAEQLTAKRPRDKGSDEQQPRKRARQSCETCKARKTKCVGIENGICQYCESIGAPCEVNLKNRKRPFYRISEEVYESSIKLLRRFVSEEELPELTVENIQATLDKLGDGPVPRIGEPSPSVPRSVHEDRRNSSSRNNGERGRESSNDSQEMMEREEHPLIQEELGCMVLDSLGKYRYVGADSSIRWNHAARIASNTTVIRDPKVIPPLRTGLLPPATPESAVTSPVNKYMPPRQCCMRYVSRFFNQIHCLYWFYSPEQFYTALDQTLEDRGSSSTFSWLCSLYSIFALGSMAPSNQPVDPNSNMPQDGKTAIDYLAMAKDLSLRVADEADIESVKAFALLSLANHAMCYSVASYLNIGTAVRIGLTLGLHRDVSIRAKETIERERGRRLWWTIYALDHEIAIRFGYPCAIVDHPTFMVTAPASEQVLDPGPNMPLGYQALLAELVRLRKKISFDCFLEPAHVAGRLPISRVTKSLSALKQWADSVPTYLSWDSSLPIQHRRSVSILHLRYWISIISVTRPFLLFSISRMGSVTVPAKRKWYQELSDTCIEAAERSVGIIKRMREDQTLSSLMLLDCHCIGEIIWILLLALRKLGKPEHQTMLRFCLDTMTSMEQIGWCEKVAPEFEVIVNESGALGSMMRPSSSATQQQQQQQQQLQQNPDLQQQNPQSEMYTPNSNLQLQPQGGNIEDIASMMPTPQFSRSYLDYMDFNFEGSQFDVFETLNLDPRTEMMHMFSDGLL